MRKILASMLISVYVLSCVSGLWMFYDETNKTSRIAENDKKEIEIELDEQEMELLARTVYGEARGESFAGQVAVAAVILNRLENPEFPDEVEEIVYEPLAFTAVADGQINLGYDEKAYSAVEKALAGEDPSNGALYYFNPDKSTSKWIWTRRVIKRIGKHHFAI